MKKISDGKIKLRKIKHVENSRLRDKDDVSDLMGDIEQRGLLHAIGIRKSDNALIFGNRRVKAFEKLGYQEIPCSFFDEVTNEDLLITNLAENIKTKSIGSIEVGRICKILMDKGMTASEIATKLHVSSSRVRSAMAAYNVTVGTPFEKLIITGAGSKSKNRKGIPESLIWKLQETLGRAKNKNLTKQDWEILLSACEEGKLTSHNIAVLRAILMTNDFSIVRALDILDKTKVIYAYFNVNKKVLAKCMRNEKIDSDVEFVKNVLKRYNKELLF